MKTAWLLFRLFPAFSMVAWGIYSILEIFFPSLRDANFDRWEVDAGEGSYIEIAGWRKVLKPPRVTQGYLSESTACMLALCVGFFSILIGVLLIRHLAGIPVNIPDVFDRS
jgi:hypothetical protein